MFFLVEGRNEVMGHKNEWPKSETDSRKTYTIDVGLEPRNEAISVFTWVRASFLFHHFHFARLSALWWFCHGLPCPARENLPSSSDSLQVGIELGFADRVSLYLYFHCRDCVSFQSQSRKGVTSSHSSPPIGPYPHGMTPSSVGCSWPAWGHHHARRCHCCEAHMSTEPKTPQASNGGCRRPGVG